MEYPSTFSFEDACSSRFRLIHNRINQLWIKYSGYSKENEYSYLCVKIFLEVCVSIYKKKIKNIGCLLSKNILRQIYST